MAQANDSHKGHRSRMLNRYKQRGIKAFTEQELLEILLYYAIPRKDTYRTAYDILAKYGTLQKMFKADSEELSQFQDIGPHAVTYISFLKDFIKFYIDKYESGINIKSTESVRRYCRENIMLTMFEEVYVIAVDDSLHFLGKSCLAQGTPNDVSVEIRKIIHYATEYRCNAIILIHTHPTQSGMPSSADVYETRKLVEVLSKCGITLIDHIVMNKDDCYSMRGSLLAPDLWI